MARMVEMVISGKVPDAVMKSAATGQLSLPAPEMLETLVFLAAHPILGSTARTTLANWDTDQLIAIVAPPATRSYVLNYFLVPKQRRMAIIPALLENPSTPPDSLTIISDTAPRDFIDLLLKSKRIRTLPSVMLSLISNKYMQFEEIEELHASLQEIGSELPDAGQGYDHSAELWMLEHEAEIAAEEGKQLELVGGM